MEPIPPIIISKLALAIAGVLAVVGPLEIYIEMNQEQSRTKWHIIGLTLALITLLMVSAHFHP